MERKTAPKAGQIGNGAVIEAFFGITNKQFIHQLLGNTKQMRNPRSITEDADPANLAVYTVEQFWALLEHYVYGVYANARHSTLHMSPRQALESSLLDGGSRTGRRIPDEMSLYVLTLPEHQKDLTIGRQGITYKDRSYWNDAFKVGITQGMRVAVRVDPWDESSIYAYVNGAWVRCICTRVESMLHLTPEKRRIARLKLEFETKEVRENAALDAQQRSAALLALADKAHKLSHLEILHASEAFIPPAHNKTVTITATENAPTKKPATVEVNQLSLFPDMDPVTPKLRPGERGINRDPVGVPSVEVNQSWNDMPSSDMAA